MLQRLFAVAALAACLSVPLAHAQQDGYDPSWYDADQSYVQVAVTEDGIYRLSDADLAAQGVPLGSLDRSRLRLVAHGQEVPLYDDGSGLVFAGYRNTGEDEANWAYASPALQSSDHLSLYTDTTTYWLSWSGEADARYTTLTNPAEEAGYADVAVVRDTTHLEVDVTYHYGAPGQSGDPRYTDGEGYYLTSLSQNPGVLEDAVYTRTLALPSTAPGATIDLRARLAGVTNADHDVALEVELMQDGSPAFVEVDRTTWRAYGRPDLAATISLGDLPDPSEVRMRLRSRNVASNTTSNSVLVDFLQAAYDRQLAPGAGEAGFSFVKPAGAANLQLSGLDAGSRYEVLVPATGTRFLLDADASGEAVFPTSSDAPARYHVRPATAVPMQPEALRRDRTSRLQAAANAADYVVLTTSLLRSTAEELASYRAEEGYQVLVVDVQDVFDEFDYGRSTPVAIRRFVRHAQATWGVPPKYLAIWGDAQFPIYTQAGASRNRLPWSVPAFGYAPSDGWYAMQNAGPDDWSESLAIGRVPIRTNADGQLYLQKLASYEGREMQGWQKNMMILVGGSSTSQQLQLQNYSLQWAATAAGPPTGMDTTHLFKRSDAPLDISFQDSMNVALRRGAGWLNYFGHSAADKWEIVTVPPAEYDNADRLPFVVSLGCRTGAFSGNQFVSGDPASFAEQLVVGSLSGAIAHFGASHEGVISTSAGLNTRLIEQVFVDTVRVAGLATQQGKAAYAAVGGRIKTLLQYNLIGDPALRLNLPDAPDFKLAASDVRVTPMAPVPADSQLTIDVTLHNWGLVPAGPMRLTVTHEDPSGDVQTFEEDVLPFRLREEFQFSPRIDEASIGTNRIVAVADPADLAPPDGQYVETNEANNRAVVERPVYPVGLTAVAPRELALVSTRQPRLRVTLASAEQLGLPVVFQLSDAGDFSEVLDEGRVTASQITADWTPAMTLSADEAYHWRARLAGPDFDDDPIWVGGAFTVRTDLGDDATGAAQQQELFARNEQDSHMTWGEVDGWAYTTYDRNITIAAAYGGASVSGFIVGSTTYERLGLGIGALILDGVTGGVVDARSFLAMPNNAGQYQQPDDPDVAFADLVDFVEQAEEGDILLFKVRNLAITPGAYPEQVQTFFQNLGSTAIDTLHTTQDLWVMSTRMGEPAATREYVTQATADTRQLVIDETYAFRQLAGETTSPVLGPATTWQQAGLAFEPASDEAEVTLSVLDPATGEPLPGFETLPVSDGGTVDLSGLDAAQQRTVRLRATLQDSLSGTPPQLQSWYALFEGLPDLALDPATLTLSSDTLQEGQPLTASITLRNLTALPVDTALVRFLVVDTESNEHVEVARDTAFALGGSAAETFSAEISTYDRVGDKLLRVEAAQLGLQGLDDATAFNNLATRPFVVRRDVAPPVCRVSVDGRPLRFEADSPANLQGADVEYVSAQPRFEITVTDENLYQAIDDPSLVEVYLGCDPNEPALPCPTVPAQDTTFYPAAPGEPARVVYTPDLTMEDATHALRVVVRDRSGNEAAPVEEAEVSFQTFFRVEQQASIRGDVLPYPNPVPSSGTCFSFELSGADVGLVDDFRIRIYTVNGRLVRELDVLGEDAGLAGRCAGLRASEAGGGLGIGVNSVFWDARDQDGDAVATGVYLYTVRARADGETLDTGEAVEKLVVIR